MRTADRNRIDRLPTRAERWTGIILSALLALVFLPTAIFVSVKTFQVAEDQVAGAVLSAVLALIGLVGAFLFYRMCFTEPRAASARAQQIYAWIAAFGAASLVVIMVVRPTTSGLALVGLVVLSSTIGVIVSRRKRKEDLGENSQAVAPSNKSLERTREG